MRPRGPRHNIYTPKPKKKRLQRWPTSKVLGIEVLKWRVWIGHQLEVWRTSGNVGDMAQKKASALSGLTQDVISRIETGQRRMEVSELVALARAYGKAPADMAMLFTAPSAEAWQKIVADRRPDPRFQAPPTNKRFSLRARLPAKKR